MKKLACFILALSIMFTGNAYTSYAAEDSIVVKITEENFPDASFRNMLLHECNYDFSTDPATEIYYDANQDGALSEQELANISYFNIGERQIVDLTGIEYFTSLVELGCQYNQIINLDLSKNTNLIYLNCYHNMLEGCLDLTNHKELIGIAAHNNPALTEIIAPNSSKLESLNFENTSISQVDLSGYPKLFSLSCGHTPLSSLDLSSNPELKVLSVYRTDLTSLDLSHNPQLHLLDASSTQLNGLDVTANPELDTLDISRTPLAWLHIGNNENLVVTKTDTNVNLTVSKDSFDVTKAFPGIDPSRMTIVSGAALTGTILSGYDFSTPIVYSYDCGTSANGKVLLNVTLTLMESADSDDDTQTSDQETDTDTPAHPNEESSKPVVETPTNNPKTDDSSRTLSLAFLSMISALIIVAMRRYNTLRM